MKTTAQNFKNRLLKGENIELSNKDDIVFLFTGHQNRFCLMFNGKVILSTKTWKPIQNKLNNIENLKETEL